MDYKVAKVLDFGSNEQGKYWKFSNGSLICQGNIKKTITVSSKSGSLYYDDGYGLQMPCSFIDMSYSVHIVANTNALICIPYSIRKTTTKNVLFDIITSVAQNNSSVEFSYIAIGRWK